MLQQGQNHPTQSISLPTAVSHTGTDIQYYHLHIQWLTKATERHHARTNHRQWRAKGAHTQ